MTMQQRREMASMGPDRLVEERNKWQALKLSVEAMRTHPLLPELERIGGHAATLWQRNAMLLNMPESGEQILHNWEQMGELYARATELRTRMMGTRMHSAFGLDPAADMRGNVMERLNESFSIDGGNNSTMRTINRTLSRYASGLTADPNAVLDGNTRDGYFYGRNRRTGNLMVNWNRVEEARRTIDRISGSPIARTNPNQQLLLQQMQSGIQQVASVDPMGAAISDWKQSIPRRQTDYRPIRFLTGVGGALIAGTGLLFGLKNGGNFSWPTALWAGVAALSINPDLARSGTFNAVKRLNRLNDPTTQNLIQHAGLSGDPGAAVVAEFQELRRNKPGLFRMLMNEPQHLTVAQISQLTDGERTPLIQAVERLGSDAERTEFFRRFGYWRNRHDQQIVREYIRGRNRIAPTLERSPFLFGDNTATA